MDIEIDGRYLRHANPTSERISDNARRRARNNRRVIQIEDAPPARLLMRFTYEAPWRKTPFHPFRFRRFLLRLLPQHHHLLFLFVVVVVVTSAGKTLCRNQRSAASERVVKPRAERRESLSKRRLRVSLLTPECLEILPRRFFDVLCMHHGQVKEKVFFVYTFSRVCGSKRHVATNSIRFIASNYLRNGEMRRKTS